MKRPLSRGGRRHRTGSLLALLLAATAHAALPASAAAGPELGPSPRPGCLQPPLQLASIGAATPSLQERPAAETAQQRPNPPGEDRERLRPLTRGELEETIAGLSPVRRKGQPGWTIRALGRGEAVDLERMGLVLNDAVATLAVLQAGDALGRLKKLGLPPDHVDLTRRAFETIRSCLVQRYAPFGGDPVFEDVAGIVESLREPLNQVLLDGLRTGTLFAPATGPGLPR